MEMVEGGVDTTPPSFQPDGPAIVHIKERYNEYIF